MPLTLTIENKASLPDGGPLSFTMVGRLRADIGRDQYLDWSLPDPQRFISGKHCEIRREDNEYLLVDVSTNGTFVNGATARVQSPYRIKHGDRLQIGEYLVVASLTADGSELSDIDAAPIQIDRQSSYDSLWDASGDVPQPIDPKHLRPPQRAQPVYGEFLYHAADVPRVSSAAQFAPAEDASLDWAPAVPKPAIVEEAPRVPEPRRPKPRALAWDMDPEPVDDGWSTPAPAAARPEPVPSPGVDDEEPPRVEEPPSADVPRRVDASPPAAAILEPVSAPVERPPNGGTQAEGSSAARATRPAASEADAMSVSASDDAFLEAFAAAAGIPLAALASRSPQELGTLLGRLVLSVTENLQQLLQARTQAKQVARSADHTVIKPHGNNPLKFSPSPQDALRVMLGPPTRSYLDATRAVAAGFADLKQHQARSLSGMQGALLQTLEALDPATLMAGVDEKGGNKAMFWSRKSALWDAYTAAWNDVSKGGPEGSVNQFMIRFGELYDKAGGLS